MGLKGNLGSDCISRIKVFDEGVENLSMTLICGSMHGP